MYTIGGAGDLARLQRRRVLLARVRGDAFPVTVLRRRLAPERMLVALVTRPRSTGRAAAWRQILELRDRDGRVVERHALSPADEVPAAGVLKVAKVNVDDEPRLAELAGVQGIPLVVLYRDGRPVARAVGAQPKSQLQSALGLDARWPFEVARHPKTCVSLDDADHLLSHHADTTCVARVLSAWASPYLAEDAAPMRAAAR